MLRFLLSITAGLALAGCEPAQNAKTAAAMMASLEVALKGEPLTVLRVVDVFKLPKEEKSYSAEVIVRRVGAGYANRYLAAFKRLCDDPKPKCWKVVRVFDFVGQGENANVVYYYTDKTQEKAQSGDR